MANITPLQPEYIITDDDLRTWRKGCVKLSSPHTNDDTCKKCEYRGKEARKDCCDFDDNAMEKIFRSRPYQSSRDTVLDVRIILDSLCNIDLYWYTKGDCESDDVGKCRGITCNYCGRYNAELRHKAGEQG